MHHLHSFIFAAVLIVCSAALIVWHVRTWQLLREKKLDDREREFRRRQYRRRVQTSALIGVEGAAIVVGQLLLGAVHSALVAVSYWSVIMLLALWIVLLAAADAVATSFYYSREKSDFAQERAKLEAELRKARGEEGKARNGRLNGGH